MDKEKNRQNDIPDYLKRNPDLYIRDGDRIIPALPEDNNVARGYVEWPDKGPVMEGRCITLMTKKKSYSVNEEIRVIHVFEATEPGKEVYIMGPKPVYGEYVNDKLVTKPPPENEDPFQPLTYNGVVLPSPNVDFNFDITTYRFSEPGTYRIIWKVGLLFSNTLHLKIGNSI